MGHTFHFNQPFSISDLSSLAEYLVAWPLLFGTEIPMTSCSDLLMAVLILLDAKILRHFLNVPVRTKFAIGAEGAVLNILLDMFSIAGACGADAVRAQQLGAEGAVLARDLI